MSPALGAESSQLRGDTVVARHKARLVRKFSREELTRRVPGRGIGTCEAVPRTFHERRPSRETTATDSNVREAAFPQGSAMFPEARIAAALAPDRYCWADPGDTPV